MADCDGAGVLERASRMVIPVGCRGMAYLRAVRRPGATFTAIVLTAFGVVQILRASNVFGEDAWKPGHRGWYGFVALACLATILSLLVTLGYRTLLRRHGARADFGTAARKTLDYVLDNTDLSRESVGVNIWRVQGIYGFRHLVRQAEAVDEGRQETHILWTKGKGAIGKCWRTKQRVLADTEELQRLLRTPEEFCQIPWDDRFRFTWQQFDDTRRFTAILALPLFRRSYGRYPLRAVLSIDTDVRDQAIESKGAQELAKLQGNDRKFGAIIRACEAVLSGDRD